MRPIAQAALVAAILIGLPLVVASAPAAAREPQPILPLSGAVFQPVPDPLPVGPGRASTGEIALATKPPPVVIYDTIERTATPTRPTVDQPTPGVIVETVTPDEGQVILSGRKATGTATWYCLPGQSACPWMASGGNYAAAGPAVRKLLCGSTSCTSWRNKYVTVSGNGKTLRVKLIDWCACGGDHIIDLFADAMCHFVGCSSSGRPLRGGFQATVYSG